jgi:transcription elongation GreA/GreB family factor
MLSCLMNWPSYDSTSQNSLVRGSRKGSSGYRVARAAQRLSVLGAVVDSAEVTKATCVAIGSRVRLRDSEGKTFDYSVVFPGDGDPLRGWVSADSPLGAAVLGREPGAQVVVHAPAGSWSVTVVDVSQP